MRRTLAFALLLAGNAAARDIFLDGNSVRDSHRVKGEPFVAAFAGGWKLSFARVFRSGGFADQPSRHSYGSFTVNRDFD